jgi:hypothetical protein
MLVATLRPLRLQVACRVVIIRGSRVLVGARLDEERKDV